MKKLLLALIISLTLLSCKKEHGTCYHCTFGYYNGVQHPPVDYCGEEGRQFKDDQGNDLSSYCVRKN